MFSNRFNRWTVAAIALVGTAIATVPGAVLAQTPDHPSDTAAQFPSLLLGAADILSTYAGVRPVVDGGKDYQYRVVGDAQVQAFGWNCSGQSVDELDRVVNGMSAVMRRLFDKIVASKAPLAFHGYLIRGTSGELHHETLFLPLGDRDDAVDHILNVSAYRDD